MTEQEGTLSGVPFRFRGGVSDGRFFVKGLWLWYVVKPGADIKAPESAGPPLVPPAFPSGFSFVNPRASRQDD